MVYSVFQKYGHLYWIPFFPIKKTTIAQCNSCKKTLEDSKQSSEIRNKIKTNNESSRIKTPIWTFSGLMIIALLAVLGFYSSFQTKKDSKFFMENPKIGDIYLVKESNGFYTTMKVDEISKDSLVLYLNAREINKESKIDNIDLSKNYNIKKRISKKHIKKLFEENTIFEVKRY